MKDFKFLGTADSEFYGTLNDISYNNTGEIVTIAGVERRYQDLSKVLLTAARQFPIPEYGATLQFFRGLNVFDPAILQEIQSAIYTSVAYISELDPGDNDDETLEAIEMLNIEPSNEEGKTDIDLQISTKSGKLIAFNIRS